MSLSLRGDFIIVIAYVYVRVMYVYAREIVRYVSGVCRNGTTSYAQFHDYDSRMRVFFLSALLFIRIIEITYRARHVRIRNENNTSISRDGKKAARIVRQIVEFSDVLFRCLAFLYHAMSCRYISKFATSACRFHLFRKHVCNKSADS